MKLSMAKFGSLQPIYFAMTILLLIFEADFDRLSILRPREISIIDKLFMRHKKENNTGEPKKTTFIFYIKINCVIPKNMLIHTA